MVELPLVAAVTAEIVSPTPTLPPVDASAPADRLVAALEALAAREPAPAPIVNVAAPQIDVHVPEARVPDVHVTVPEPRPHSVRVEVDGDGTKRYVPIVEDA